ncbi:MAG: hypothetical protein ACYCSF_13520 [Acidimicrobiales bacterium]
MPPETPDSPDGNDTRPDGQEPYTPPNFLEAVKTIFQPNGPRQRTRAQPASGTEADAKAVNYIDRRERIIAGFLSIFQIVLGIVVYFEERRLVQHASNKRPKISVAQAHRDTLNYHHVAPELLIINLILGLAIAGGVLSKRRALVGFTVLLGGLGMNVSGGGVIGIVYLGIGIWLIFRSMRRTPSARAAAGSRAASARASSSEIAARPARSGGRSASGTAAAKASRRPPPPSKRYTPPSARRPALPRPGTNAEPDKESRLTSWLRR